MFTQTLHVIDTVVTVFVPLLAIILMNVGIGVKICVYTAGRARLGGQGPSLPADSADEIYSNCSTNNKCAMEPMRSPVGALGDGGVAGVVASKRGSVTTRAVVSVSAAAAAGGGAAGGGTAWRVLTRRKHTQARVTGALLVVSSVFVILNIPSYAFRIHMFVNSIRDETYEISMNAYIWQEFIQFLYYSNISSRFFLYAACSRNFRYAVRRLACRQRCAARRRCRWRG